MGTVTVRELRNHGGDVLARVMHGESLVVTRDGEEVAQLQPVRRTSRATALLIANRRNLPRIDAKGLRADLDEILDAEL